MEAKKLLNLRILQILENDSDYDHPLTQQQIISTLEREYGLTCERKAVGRNVSFLREAGVEVESDGRGIWLAERRFEKSEIQLLIDSVIASRFVDENNTKMLIEKLKKEGGKFFRPHLRGLYNNDEWQKTPNKELFLTIEVLDEAIEKGCKVEFFYNHYGIDKKLKKRKNDKYSVSPYHLILKNQRYYLLASPDTSEDMRFFRLDLITGIELSETPCKQLKTIPGYERNFNLSALVSKLPYMYLEKPERIVFVAKAAIMNDLVDWFGYGFKVKKMDTPVLAGDGEEVEITLSASPRAMRYWLLQYGTSVRAVAPESLVNDIKNDINQMKKNYGAKL